MLDEGEEYGLHGSISNIPAEYVNQQILIENDCAVLKLSGYMRQARMLHEHLILEREISCKYGDNSFSIHDTIENRSSRDEPLMLLYHFNFGYPFISENAYLMIPSKKVLPGNDAASKNVADYSRLCSPTRGFNDEIFNHDLKAGCNGDTFSAIVNPDLELGLVLKFNINQLPRFSEWKMLGEGEYLVSLEPSNCTTKGRAEERRNGLLHYIGAWDKKSIDYEIEFFNGKSNIESIKGLERSLE